MPDREKVIKALEDFNKNRICLPHLIPWDEIADAIILLKEQEDIGTELTNAVELIHKKNERIEKLLKEQEYKDRMFHALEDDWKAMQKEQEAVEPVFEVKNPNVVGQFHCGNCHHAFCYSHYKFCPECGRKVKWE